jgi:hypothetical protein
MAARHRNRNSSSKITWQGEATQPAPPKTCSVSGKRMYPSEREAKATANHIMSDKQSGLPQLRTYLCLYCDAWHLTSKQA